MTDAPHARAGAHAFPPVMHSWHAAAFAGSVMYAATPPHGRSHAASQLPARHALSAETSVASVPTGWSIVHVDRQTGSPLQAPRQLSYALHVVSAAHAADSPLQWSFAQAAHVVVP